MPHRMNTRFSAFRFGSDRRGAVSVMFTLMLVPMIICVGAAVDYGRMVQYKADLQNAVDEAALAGAAAFLDSSEATNAQDTATNYFYSQFAGLPVGTLTSLTVTPNANGTINPALGTASALTVTVTANATIPRTFLTILGVQPLGITATGTAGDPVLTPNLSFTNVSSRACDGNSAFLYQVPKKANGGGYDYTSVPAFTTGASGNYYEIGTSFAGSSSPYATLPAGQSLPTITANQPLGFMMQNITNGNTGNPSCGAPVMGANSYGAPDGAVQEFYSSLLPLGESPSEDSNYTYTAVVTTSGRSGTISSVTVTLPPSTIYPDGTTITEPLAPNPYNNLWTYLGGASNGGASNCTSSTSGSTTTYTCTTQYPTSLSSTTPNCSLYIQTGVTQSYVNGLNNNSPTPAAAVPNCTGVTPANYPYAAPTCSQISQLANGTHSASVVYWWDDAGGVGPNEQFYGPASHCTQISSSDPGYGEDCQYQNNFFAVNCTVSGGSGSGLTQVVLTQ